jgi:peptide chain release factor 2
MRSVKPDFWSDQAAARNMMQKLAENNRTVEEWRSLEQRLSDLSEMSALADEDMEFREEFATELDSIAEQLDKLELELAFSGEYDSRNALMSIHAGAGGTESQDWAEMLERMYLRWAERRGYRAEILESSPGDEAGLKSATIAIRGEHAFGYLKSEHGVHRLVRLSPFDSDHARHTSFVLIEVIPEAEPGTDVTIDPDEVKIETFRSSGPGGQHMQKTSSAVRITHLPSGLVVTCQSERSQHQNKDIAMTILQSRLLNLEMERRAEEVMKLKGERVLAGWSNQIRSYVLHPYKMVKDHRTDYQSANPDAVLDGELDDFITAYLRSLVGQEQ